MAKQAVVVLASAFPFTGGGCITPGGGLGGYSIALADPANIGSVPSVPSATTGSARSRRFISTLLAQSSRLKPRAARAGVRAPEQGIYSTVDSSGRPAGELLARVATVNDLHLGESECGILHGIDVGPTLRVAPGDEPYPTVMSRAAVSEIAAVSPDAVVVKGDLTASGSAQQHQEFVALYRPAFGDRLLATPGNHDKPHEGGAIPSYPAMEAVDLPGVTLAVLDTARTGQPGGEVSTEQAEWLDELAARADRPVLVFGHHPADGDDMHVFGEAAARAACLDPGSTQRLASTVARRAAIVGYFAGHTHRNKVRRLPCTGPVPWVEVASVKDFPGSWAEYLIYDGWIEQVHHRISTDPVAVRWSERCRAMFAGFYPAYALGEETDRTFGIPLRSHRPAA